MTLDLDFSAEDDPEQDAVDGPTTGPVTWSVADLHTTISDLLSSFFDGEIWVEGEIRNLNRSKNGHVYFDLVDSDQADEPYPPSLSIVLFDWDRKRVNKTIRDQGGDIRMSDGVRVRVRGKLSTYASRSSLQLRMSAIDPHFTLGVLEMLRKQVLAALEADDLLDRNATTFLTPVPLRIGIVTSIGSAAHADAMEEFDGAGLGMEVFLFDARVQGAEAGDSLATALRRADDHGVDVILVIRGGGARTDLAAFDLEVVARAIAVRSVPVFTGIGHEIDMSIADIVSYRSFKTPTATAAAVCDMVREAQEESELAWESVHTLALDTLTDIGTRLDMTGEVLARSSVRHLNQTSRRLDSLTHSLGLTALTRLDRFTATVDDAARRTVVASRRSLDQRRSDLDALEALVRARDPHLALARGWSITRTADGRIIRSPEDVTIGDVVSIETAGGTITATVTGTALEQNNG